MLTFYMTPGSCTTGIHILLEELEQIFQVEIVNLLEGDHESESFVAINPKSSIPTLKIDDDFVITEFQAIAYWLARSNPKAGLLGDNLKDEVKIIEMMEYAVATLHMQGFARIFTTDKFCDNESEAENIKQRGREIIDKCFAVIDDLFNSSGYIVEKFSIADAALFYTEFWANHIGIPLPDNCQKHFDLMLSRPKVKQVLYEEGYRIE